MRRSTAAAGLLALASRASAQLDSVCPTSNVCFKLNIPDATASSGSGDIFFQISAPDSYQWAALGQGSRMANSNIFVIYTDGKGNVTLSPRSTSNYNMPTFNGNVQATLLEGSGVSGGKMIANVKCSNCNKWNGGTADFTSGSGSWIYGYKAGGAADSTDTNFAISQHDEKSAFNWDYSSAKGGNSVNPFISNSGGGSSPSGTGSGGSGGGASITSCVPRAANTGGSGSGSASGSGASPTSTGDDDNDDDKPTATSLGPATAAPTNGHHWGPPSKRTEEKRQQINYCDENGGSNGSITPIGAFGDPFAKQKKMLQAHGIMAALAFVIFFPTGAIAIRLASFTGVVWVHAAFQTFAYLLYIIAFGLGVYLANEFNLLNETHPIIGIVVFVVLFFQPIFGFLHHALFKKYQSRTFWSYLHLWIGRAVITLGIVNGGLGMKLADKMQLSSRSGMIAYGVVAGIMWLAWVIASIIGERRRKRNIANAPPKYSDRSPPAETSESPRRSDIPHPEEGHYAPR